MATRDSNDDHERSRLVCKPWDGSRSAEFRAAFMRDDAAVSVFLSLKDVCIVRFVGYVRYDSV